MSKQSVRIDDVDYVSRSAAARALVEKGMSVSEVAKAVGITVQTVVASTTGLESRKHRLNKKRAIKLASSKRGYTTTAIAKKVGYSESTLRHMFKKIGIVPVGTAKNKEQAKAKK